MHFNRVIFLLALTVACATPAASQVSTCELKVSELKQAPELYGLRMGATLEQVKVVVPSLQTGPGDDLGFSTTSFSPEFNSQIDKRAYAGVRTVSLEFLDGKLFALWIGFNSSYKWKTLEEFVPGMTNALGLPPGAWKASATKPSIDCNDFEITASMIGGGPSIRITDKVAKEIWEQRREEKANKNSEPENDDP